MGRAGRAEKVRAPIGGCNIVLGREKRKACGQGSYVVQVGGEGGKGAKGGKNGKSGKGGKGGKGGKSGKGAGTYWRL